MSLVDKNVSGGPLRRFFAVVGRVAGWGVLGGLCGLALGFGNGVLHAPAEVPGDNLANEWYPVGVIFIVFVECVAGSLIGAGIALAAPTPKHRRKAFAFALGGAVLGLVFGWVLARVFQVVLADWSDGSELVSDLIVQAAGVIGALILSVSGQTQSMIRSAYD